MKTKSFLSIHRLLSHGVLFAAFVLIGMATCATAAPGDVDPTFSPGGGINNTVRSMALSPSGGTILIGGDFSFVSGVSRFGIARVLTNGIGDGTFNTAPAANAPVWSVASQTDGKVVIGGQFTTVAGGARNGIARLNADASLDTSFNPPGGANSIVLALAVQPDGKVLLGGQFSAVNGQSRNFIARMNADGTLDTSFNTPFGGANGPVYAIALQSDGKVLIGGNFSGISGQTRVGIARLNTDGTLDSSFAPTPGIQGGSFVYSVAVQSDGKVVIGGQFTAVNGAGRNMVARLNSDGSLDTSFNPGSGASAPVQAVALQSNGKVLIGGQFGAVNGIGRSGIARLNINGSLDTGFSPGSGANGTVYSIVLQPDGKVLVGGAFTAFNGSGAYTMMVRLQGDPPNSAPTDIALSNASVAENQPPGTTVGTLSATDPDAGDTHTFSLVPGSGDTDNARFFISGNSLTTTAMFDYETAGTLNVRVRATDSAANTFEEAFIITVNDVNDSPSIYNQSFSVNENSANGTVVGTVAASDPDAGQTLSYSITAGNTGGAFAINSSSGQISVANSGALNYETTPSYLLTVRVADNGSPSSNATATVTVNLNDVLPQLVHQWTFADGTATDSIGTTHGTLFNGASISAGRLLLDGVNDYVATVDLPGAGATLTNKTIVAWVALSNLSQRAGGVVSVANYNGTDQFDAIVYGESVGGQWMAGSDFFNRSSTGGASETVINSNVMIAITYAGNAVTIYRNGSQYATYTYGTSPQPPSYPAAGRTAAVYFGVRHEDLKTGSGAAAGTDAFLAGAIDEVRIYNARLSAAEVAALYTAQPANNPPVIASQSFSVNENSVNGTVVGTVLASDDPSQTLTYSITAGNTGGAFAINSSSGEITVANSGALNYETTPSHSLTVRAADNGSPSLNSSATVTINLNDVNDAPVGANATVTTLEDTPYEFSAADFGFTDSDNPANNFTAVKITSLPASGTLMANGASVNAGDFVSPYAAAAGTTWTARESARNWQAVASSADGSRLVAVVQGPLTDSQIYTSTDSGVTWTPRESNRSWTSVASSADGTTLVAANTGGHLYVSADSGVNWTPRMTDANRAWNGVASSTNGVKLAAAVNGGQIYTSTDSGTTWTPRPSGNRSWQSIASSADGTRLVAVDNGGGIGGRIYTSADSGLTWVARGITTNWLAVASSADGMKLVAGGMSAIFTSSDGGTNWTPRPVVASWSSFASSSDGTKLVAVANPGRIFISTNSGATWTARESTRNWRGAASSSDGSKLLAVDWGTASGAGGRIYTSSAAATLTFVPVANENGTPYTTFTFKVQDDGGTANDGVDLDTVPRTITINVTSVIDSPVISVQPQSQTQEYSTDVTLSVTGSGVAPLSYQWYRGNSGDTSALIAGATSSSFTFNVNYLGASNYWVRVTSDGEADSSTATVTGVDTTPPTINCPANVVLNDADNNCSESATFAATASDASGTPTITYSSTSGSNFPVGTTVVTATATDSSGNSSQCQFSVIVNDVTVPIIASCVMTQTNISDLSFQAPVPNFTGSLIASDTCSAITKSQSPTVGTSLGLGDHLINFTVTDAFGNESTCSSTWRLIPPAPTIALNPCDKVVFANSNVTLTVSGTSTWLSYQWRKDGTPIAGETTDSLTLTSVQASDAGQYDVVVSNEAGSATSLAAWIQIFVPGRSTAGAYDGLFYESCGVVRHNRSGYFRVLVGTGTAGNVSVRTRLGSAIYYSKSMSFDTNNFISFVNGPLAFRLYSGTIDGAPGCIGTVTGTGWSADLLAYKRTFSTAAPTPLAGNYALVLQSSGNGVSSPAGHGVARVRITAAGIATISGNFGDGSAFSHSTFVGPNGEIPFYAVPGAYGGKGSVLGWLRVTASGANRISGDVSWIKTDGGTFYPSGFTNIVSTIGSPFNYVYGVRTIAITNGIAQFSGGNLVAPFSVNVNIADNNVVTASGPQALLVQFAAISGYGYGTVKNPSTGKTMKIRFIPLQLQNSIRGYCLGPNKSSSFEIIPND